VGRYGEKLAFHDPASPSNLPKHSRLDSLDGLRAVALLGILIVNAMSFATGVGGDSLGGLDADSHTVDVAAYAVTALFFEYKFYPIFATLLGFGIGELWRRWERLDAAFGQRWLRRMIVLAALGAVNGVFIYAGDVLSRYAAAGFLFWLLSPARMSARTAYRRAAIWAGVSVGLGALFGVLASVASRLGGSMDQFFGRNADAMFLYATGSYGDITLQRLEEYAAILGTAPFFSIPCFLACFYLGYALHRSRFWQRALRRPALARRWLVVGLAIGVPVNLLYAAVKVMGQLNQSAAYLGFESMLGVPISALGFAYAGAWLLLWPRVPQKLQAGLAAAGRMALSNYLASALIFSLMLYGYGSGFGDKWGPAKLLFASFYVWLVVVVASVLWQRSASVGPAEWLYRRLGGR
jgi:uncharacterized protein